MSNTEIDWSYSPLGEFLEMFRAGTIPKPDAEMSRLLDKVLDERERNPMTPEQCIKGLVDDTCHLTD